VSVRCTYVYLDGKHSHDYVACDAIPSVSPCPTTSNHRAGERTGGPAYRWYAAVAFLRARMPPVFNDLIKNVNPTRDDDRRRPPHERSTYVCVDLATSPRRSATTSGHPIAFDFFTLRAFDHVEYILLMLMNRRGKLKDRKERKFS